MAVTVTICVPACVANEPPVHMDLHHLYESGEMLETPLRRLDLRVGGESCITMHCRMALVIRRGKRVRLPLDIIHGDKAMTRGLLLTEWVFDGTGAAIELSRRRVPPGEKLMVALERAEILVIREIEEPAP